MGASPVTPRTPSGPRPPGSSPKGSPRNVDSGSFGRERRLRKRAEFVRVQSLGRRVSSAHFLFLVAAQPGADPDARPPSRLGLVVSRKIGGAVQRNRVKRLCRECFRTWPELLPSGVDLVIIPRPSIAARLPTLKLADVQAEWQRASGALARAAREALASGLAPKASEPHVPRVRRRGPRQRTKGT